MALTGSLADLPASADFTRRAEPPYLRPPGALPFPALALPFTARWPTASGVLVVSAPANPAPARVRDLPGTAWVIFAGMFLNKFGNFLHVFLVLFLVAQGYSAAQAGLALGVAGLGAFLGNTLGGTAADRFGRRSAIALSMFGSAAATAALPFISGLTSTLILVGAVGVFAQLYRPAAGALLIDVVPEHQRITAFGALRLAVNVGMALGPLVGALLSNSSYTYAFLADAATSVAFGLLALLMLPKDTPSPSPASTTAAPRGGYRAVLTDRAYVYFLLAMFAATYVYQQSMVTLPLHVADAHLGNAFYGLLLGLNALLCVLLELPITRRIQKHRPTTVITLGLALLGIGMGLTGLADTQLALAGTVALWTLGEMIYTPSANAYPADFAPAHLRGRYQGAEGAAHTLGAGLGPVAGGFLYAASTTTHWIICAAIGLLGAALIRRAVPSTTTAKAPQNHSNVPASH